MTMPRPTLARARRVARGFTVVELLIVLAIILLLLGILLPALGGAFGVARSAAASERLRQIATWMTSYSQDNKDLVLPARFRHPADLMQEREIRRRIPGLSYQEGPAGQGTWADVIWVREGLASKVVGPVDTVPGGEAYQYEAPDRFFYEELATSLDVGDDDNPLRSNVANSQNAVVGVSDQVATPWGDGAQEGGLPGYFAANGFFDVVAWQNDADAAAGSRSGHWSNGQIRRPASALYLVDSFYGEIIADEPFAWDATTGSPSDPIQVDFRYGRTCLMLFLDGRVDAQTEWIDLVDLEESPNRGVQVRDLTSR